MVNIVTEFITVLNESSLDEETLEKCLKAANMEQTVLEQMGAVHALESFIKNELGIDDNVHWNL